MNAKQSFLFENRRICWFSCGAASAVAAKLTVEKHKTNVEVIYCNILSSEHPDNTRFKRDVEEWIGVQIKTISNPNFNSVDDVFEQRKFMSGFNGAPCTIELKKKPRFAYQHPCDIHIFGMTKDELKRVRQFERDNHELRLEWPLVQQGLNKADTLEIVRQAGIKLPEMYQLGYANNNCIGCVKAASPAYWNKIRKDFPETFSKRCEQSRRFGTKLVKVKGTRIFLDELDNDCQESIEEDLSCGPQCKGEIE